LFEQWRQKVWPFEKLLRVLPFLIGLN